MTLWIPELHRRAAPCHNCGKTCMVINVQHRYGHCWGETTEDRSLVRGHLHRYCSGEHVCEGHRHINSESVYEFPPSFPWVEP